LVNVDPEAAVGTAPNQSDPDRCLVPDTTVRDLSDRTLGFPRRSSVPASGVIDLVLVAADFAEYPGDAGELEDLREQLAEFDRWLDEQSGGTLEARWHFPERWVRMPRSAADYRIDPNQPDTAAWLISDIVDAIDPEVDFGPVVEAFVAFPTALVHSVPREQALTGVIAQFSRSNTPTDEGEVPRFKGIGTMAQFSPFGLEKPLWSAWAHELLHTLGLELHSPILGRTIDDGDTTAMSAWSRWLLGWLAPGEVACIPRGTEGTITVDLLPLPTSGDGVRALMVPLGETSILVIESHRDHGSQVNLSDAGHGRIGAYGIVAYVIDTTVQEIKREYTDSGNRWVFPDDDVVARRGPVSVGHLDNEFLLGESLRFEEITVDFVASGHTDRLELAFD
jgi:hypothetical protein